MVDAAKIMKTDPTGKMEVSTGRVYMQLQNAMKQTYLATAKKPAAPTKPATV